MEICQVLVRIFLVLTNRLESIEPLGYNEGKE